jgi:rRNA maturation RNase YbeY
VPVEVSCDVKGADRHARLLREEAPVLLRLLDREYCELSILLTGDRHIRQLNAEYRYLIRATDVLSFAPDNPAEASIVLGEGEYRPPDAILIGDVVISLETAMRQARELKQSVGKRLRSLLVHGVLHLLGYDHERSKGDAKLMFDYQFRLEDALEAEFKSVQPAAGPSR